MGRPRLFFSDHYCFCFHPRSVRKVLARLKYSVPLYKAGIGFSILTEEYLTFQTVSPINHPYRDATHISIVASPLALFCRIVLPVLHFLNNLHVELFAILLIINSLRGYLKVRLPIFSCNLSLTFLTNMLCISALDDTRRARLFSFSLSAIPNCIGNYLYNCYLVEKT